MAEERSAPTTRWANRGGASGGRPLDGDEVVWRLVGLACGVVVGLVLLPALLVGAALAGLWSARGWSRRWLLVAAATVTMGAWPLADQLIALGSTGVTDLVATGGRDAAVWLQLLAVTAPGSLTLGAVLAAAWLTWRQVRAPSWRGAAPPSNRHGRRTERRNLRRLATDVLDDGKVLVGVDTQTGVARGLPVSMLGRHALVVGSTGSGKTTTATRLATATLERGGGLLVVDLKGDPDTIVTWRRAAARHGRTSTVWGFGLDSVYDPLAAGGVSERTRKVMALAEWTEPYYRDQAEQLLQLALRALDEAGERPTLGRLHAVMSPAGLAELHGRTTGPAGVELARETSGMTPGRLSAIESLRTKLALLTQADFGPQLDPDQHPSAEPLDLAAALDGGDVVVISLDELSYGHIAARMAEVVLTDVAAAAGARLRARARRPAMVWVDEFSAMRPGPLASLFARVRSADIALLLSTQEVSDLDREDPTFRAAVATNVATVLAHRVHDPESAEWLARLIGTRPDWQETSQVEAVSTFGAAHAAGGATGLGTIREVEQYVVHPNDIKSLPDHHVYLARLDQRRADARARLVRVVALATEPEPAAAADTPDGDTAEGSPHVVADGTSPLSTASRTSRPDSSGEVPTVPTVLPGDEW